MNNNSLTDQQPSKHFAFQFKGQAGDFFGIWFVNSFLNLLTFGLYAPWAKVRTQQYFYGNTSLAGGHFQFLANPLSLFKTRLIALGLFIVFFFAQNLADAYITAAAVYVTMVVIYLVIAPIMLVMFMSFRLRYSAWRGIAFKFNKDYAGAYRVYLAPTAVFALLVASIALPFYFANHSTTGADTETASLNNTNTYPLSDTENALGNADAITDNSSANDSNDEQAIVSESHSGELVEENLYEEDDIDEESEGSGLFTNLKAIHFLPALILGLLFAALLPYFDFINNRFLARNAQFGTAKLKFLAKASDYYKVYGVWLAATVGLLLLWSAAIYLTSDSGAESDSTNGISRVSVMLWMSILTALYYLMSKAYLKSKRYNLFAGNLEIGNGHRVLANATFLGYLWLMISNSMGYSLSFGLLKAWVMVRTARYYLNSTSFLAFGSLEEFTAAEKQAVNSLAEETADVFDLDLA